MNYLKSLKINRSINTEWPQLIFARNIHLFMVFQMLLTLIFFLYYYSMGYFPGKHFFNQSKSELPKFRSINNKKFKKNCFLVSESATHEEEYVYLHFLVDSDGGMLATLLNSTDFLCLFLRNQVIYFLILY